MTHQHPGTVEAYERFFGFNETPFSVAPNPRFLFGSASYTAALAQVAYALDRREPLVVVTGDIGTGKTLLCRTVVERLERKTFVSVISDPLLERDDLLKLMLQDFGVISKDRTKLIPATRHDLIHALEEFLSSLGAIHGHAILIIDEAQHVQPDVMEQIRLLSNVQDESGTMLQIILVGQTDLDRMLSRPELCQVRQRVSRCIHLDSLSNGEVAAYIEHRLAVARGGSKPDAIFTADAVDAVSRLSGGVPRVVNILCDRALEAACAQQLRGVDVSLIEQAARALELAQAHQLPDSPPPLEQTDEHVPFAFAPGARRGYIWAAALALIAIAIGLGVGLKKRSRSADILPRADVSHAIAPGPAGTSMTPEPPEPAAPVLTAATVESAAEAFEIVVASFRTEARARAVAAALAALDQPVRRRVADGWQQVLAGPFASRTMADEAQQRLERAGFIDTHIVRTGR